MTENYRTLTFAEKAAGTIRFAATELKQRVRKLPGFQDLWRVTEMTDEEIEEDLKILKKERLNNELRQAGFSQEVRVCEPEETQPRTAGPFSLSELIRSAARRR